MKKAFSHVMVATLVCLCCLAGSIATAGQNTEPEQAGGQAVVVQDKFGGQIFGYGIDRNGSEGMLSEILALSDGKLLIATETFDQKTGKIIKVVAKKTETLDNFITLGVVGSHIGLEQVQHVKGIFVVKRTYNILNPIDGNKLTGPWTPPLDDKKELFEDVEADQGTPNVAVMASPDACCGRFVFGSDVAANTFGPKIVLKDSIFTGGVPPIMAFDSKTNQAVLAQAQGSPFSVPEIALANLTKSKITEFTGLGFGLVNGLAVDSATGIACTTTETDNSAEFYNLAKKTGFIVVLPVIGKYSGAAVAVDPLHKLFFITHPVPGAPGQIHVYNEKGNLIKSLTGIDMGPAGLYVALNPSKRTGFVQTSLQNGGSALQAFTY
ncbi:MAG TPA: hypothetical protein VN948_02385 [Terriglobales bacterium]|nr:hypothetical protein [Terriglobales bacterium]